MGWENIANSLIKERNQAQCDSYVDIYSAFCLMEKKNRSLKKKHVEIRNRIGVLQYEIQEAIYQKTANLEEIKSKLSIIADDLSPRSAKEYDDIKVRYELTRKIRDQEYLIFDLRSEAETARTQLSKSLEEVARLQEEVSSKEAINLVLKQEIESTRSYLTSAELRLKSVEAENIQFAQRLLDEKQKNIQQMNEMNKLIQSGPSLLGGVMKRFGTGTFFTRSPENIDIPTNESDIEDDFVDVIGGSAKKTSEDNHETDDNYYANECFPPRRPVQFSKCHNSEINDLCYNKPFFMTAGSDSAVKIFERKSSGHSVELSTAEVEEMSPQDPRHSFLTGGPVISLDLKGDWIAAGCSDRIARIWSVSSGRLRHNLSGHANKINSIRLAGSGEERAVTGSADRIIRIWDISRSQPNIIGNLKVNSCVDCVSISSDCNTIVSGHQDGGLRLWNMHTKDRIHAIPKLHSTHITSAHFDPRRNHVILTASRDNTLSLIDCRTYEPLMILRAPGFSLTTDWSQVAYSPDSSYIAAGGSNGALYLWNALSGEFMQSIPGHKSGIVSVFWGEYGVLSCDKQGAVIQWG